MSGDAMDDEFMGESAVDDDDWGSRLLYSKRKKEGKGKGRWSDLVVFGCSVKGKGGG